MKVWIIGLVIVSMSLARTASADPLTAATVLLTAREATQGLQRVANDLGGAAQVVVGQTTTQMNSLINELDALAKDRLQEPLANLGVDAQNAAHTLNITATNLNRMLTLQRTCLANNLNVFLAGVQTAAQTIKSGIPFVDVDGVYVSNFQFDNHIPAVVPLDGGNVTISGFNLWQDVAPKISVVDSNSTAVKSLSPLRGRSNNEFMFTLPKSFITEHGGECLAFNVQPQEMTGFLWWKKPAPITEVNMPFCVPNPDIDIQLKGKVQYETTQATEYDVATNTVNLVNHSCENASNISQNFTVPLGEGCRIINATPVRGDLTYRERGTTTASFTNTTITLNGGLEQAQCVCLPLAGCTKTHHSDWNYSAVARVRCESNATSVREASSPWADLRQNNENNLCVSIPKEGSPIRSVASFSLHQRHLNDTSVLFTSPSITATTATVPFSPAHLRGYAFSGSYNPGLPSGSSELCVNFRAEACGY